MLEELVAQDRCTFIAVLKACKELGVIGRIHSVHDSIVKSGYGSDISIGSILVDVYAKSGNINEAHIVFDLLPQKNVVSWGSLITGYAAQYKAIPAIYLFEKMQGEGVEPDGMVIVSVLKACSLSEVGRIRLIHDRAIRCKCEDDIFISSALIDIYAKHGYPSDAEKIFNRISHPNGVAWASVIGGHAENGDDVSALRFVDEMQQQSVKMDRVACLSILKACGRIRALQQGRLMHGQAVKGSLCLDTAVGNALVDLYARCGSIDEAHRVFERLTRPDVMSWGAIIMGYAGNGLGEEAFQLFYKMQGSGIEPNLIVLIAVVKACTIAGCMAHGMLTHEEVVIRGLESDATIGSMLVDMYAKRGKLDDARNVFSALQPRDLAAWGAMILGCVLYGDGPSALKLYGEMQQDNRDPDSVIFLCILQACSNTGALEQGKLVHGHIIEGKLELDIDIGNTLVNMYAKCGAAKEAHRVFDSLPSQTEVSWSAVIMAYAECEDFGLVEQCLKKMQLQGLKPCNALLTNILVACCHAGAIVEGCHHFELMVHEYGIVPDYEHYNCIIGLLGRSGCLNEASALTVTMPVPPDRGIWTSLLTDCTTFHNLELGRTCLKKLSEKDPDGASPYALMSRIDGDVDMWEAVG